MSRSSLGRFGLMLVSLLGLMSLLSASALASGPPIVTVGAASNLSLNTATLNGTVDKNGANATYKFEYGKSKLYGKSTTVKSQTGTGAVPVSALVAGLEPLATYHFRISATNSFGTTVSEDMTFEMLLSWKVEGKFPSELAEAPYAQSWYGNEPVTLEYQLPNGLVAKIACHSGFGGYGKNLLVVGQEYNLPFKGCKVFAGATEVKNCTPVDTILHLNAFAEATGGQSLFLGSKCTIAEEVSLAGGFAIGAMAEQKTLDFTLTETTVDGWKVNYGPVKWSLVGPFTGMKFGVL